MIARFDHCGACADATIVAVTAAGMLCKVCLADGIRTIDALLKVDPAKPQGKAAPTHTAVTVCRKCKGWRAMGGDWTNPYAFTASSAKVRKTVEDARKTPHCECPIRGRK